MTRHDSAAKQPAVPQPEPRAAASEAPRPELRKVPVQILSAMGWVSGLLHVPLHQTLVEFLTMAPRMVKLTRVRMPQEPDPRTFVAFQREAVTLVAPSLDDGVVAPGETAFTAVREVACLLSIGVLRGSLAVLLHMRLSDHLQQQGSFITLRHCLLTPYGQTSKSPEARAFGTVIVNLNAVLGVSEET